MYTVYMYTSCIPFVYMYTVYIRSVYCILTAWHVKRKHSSKPS